jgi:hypothetical protein
MIHTSVMSENDLYIYIYNDVLWHNSVISVIDICNDISVYGLVRVEYSYLCGGADGDKGWSMSCCRCIQTLRAHNSAHIPQLTSINHPQLSIPQFAWLRVRIIGSYPPSVHVTQFTSLSSCNDSHPSTPRHCGSVRQQRPTGGLASVSRQLDTVRS